MNGPCTTIRQYRDRDQSIQDGHDAELEAARQEADSFSFGLKHKFTNTRLEIVMRHSLNQVVDTLMAARRQGVDVEAEFKPKYALDVHDHDTGTKVSIVAQLGDEKLLVWDYHYWKSSQYEFNNREKILGLQVAGPWADHIDDILDEIKTKTENAIAAKEQKREDRERSEVQKYADKVDRFRAALYNSGVSSDSQQAK